MVVLKSSGFISEFCITINKSIMNKKIVVRTFWLVLFMTFISGSFNLYGQENGYWKLDRIESNDKIETRGKLTRKTEGKPGDLVYTFDNGSNGKLIVNGTWAPLPEVLYPKKETDFTAKLEIQKFDPPPGHFSPIVFLNFASGYSKGTVAEMKIYSVYCKSSLRVRATTSNDPKKDVPKVNETVTIKAPQSPEKLKGDLFIIRVKMGSTTGYREFFYIYKWQPAS